MRHLIRRILLPAVAVVGLLATALPAEATQIGLFGGIDCYGYGQTTAGGGAVNAKTFTNGYPCNGATQVYLAATTPAGYADYPGSWGTVGIYWGTAAPSVQGTHNLCHFSCNGYVNTSA